MTKLEAIRLMEQGKKVTHRYFSANEFITIKGGQIVTDEGYSLPMKEFWAYRNVDGWNDGWTEFTDNKYPLAGYAPGSYQCKCVSCGKGFIGDKMAVQCEPCAKNSVEEGELALEAMEFYWRHAVGQLARKDLGDIERKNYEKLEQKTKAYVQKYFKS